MRDYRIMTLVEPPWNSKQAWILWGKDLLVDLLAKTGLNETNMTWLNSCRTWCILVLNIENTSWLTPVTLPRLVYKAVLGFTWRALSRLPPDQTQLHLWRFQVNSSIQHPKCFLLSLLDCLCPFPLCFLAPFFGTIILIDLLLQNPSCLDATKSQRIWHLSARNSTNSRIQKCRTQPSFIHTLYYLLRFRHFCQCLRPDRGSTGIDHTQWLGFVVSNQNQLIVFQCKIMQTTWDRIHNFHNALGEQISFELHLATYENWNKLAPVSPRDWRKGSSERRWSETGSCASIHHDKWLQLKPTTLPGPWIFFIGIVVFLPASRNRTWPIGDQSFGLRSS